MFLCSRLTFDLLQVVISAQQILNRDATDSALAILDDISIHPGDCQLGGTCDFEDGTECSWSESANDDLDWIVVKAGSPANVGGPGADHSSLTEDGKLLNRFQSLS